MKAMLTISRTDVTDGEQFISIRITPLPETKIQHQVRLSFEEFGRLLTGSIVEAEYERRMS